MKSLRFFMALLKFVPFHASPASAPKWLFLPHSRALILWALASECAASVSRPLCVNCMMRRLT